MTYFYVMSLYWSLHGRPKSMCFNCGSGSHQMRECPKVSSWFVNMAQIQIRCTSRTKTCFTTFAHCWLPSPKTWLQLMREERSLIRTTTRPCRVTTDTMLMKWRSDSLNTNLVSWGRTILCTMKTSFNHMNYLMKQKQKKLTIMIFTTLWFFTARSF